eukprot:TRINITY_DN549_c0_g1_i1.p2 TRINITY_DN549_c0_g1~~TRINITY_DN549_c0_g1_i1.p2  ORF type:complete len:359 (+),score=35.02 TRINITY_DN549_c0_g1_i1:2407-3483(+)
MRFILLCGWMLLAQGAGYVDCDGASVVIESLLVPIHQLPMYQTAGRQLRLEAPAGDGRTYRIEGTVPAHQLLEPAVRAALKDLPEDLLSEAQKEGLMERAYASVLGYEPRMPSKRYDARISRTHFLAVLAAHRGCKDYLEIGCDNGINFRAVTTSAALRGTCVDPLPGGTHVMTSDEFFSQYQGAGFDLVFIDGMHEKHQVLRDVNNALKWLKQGGTIVLHDCAPRNRSMAQRLGVEERRSHLWNGDVYRAVIELRARLDLEVFVGDFDFGVGIVRRARNICPLPIAGSLPGWQQAQGWGEGDVTAAEFAYFKQHEVYLSDLMPVEEFFPRAMCLQPLDQSLSPGASCPTSAAWSTTS